MTSTAASAPRNHRSGSLVTRCEPTKTPGTEPTSSIPASFDVDVADREVTDERRDENDNRERYVGSHETAQRDRRQDEQQEREGQGPGANRRDAHRQADEKADSADAQRRQVVRDVREIGRKPAIEKDHGRGKQQSGGHRYAQRMFQLMDIEDAVQVRADCDADDCSGQTPERQAPEHGRLDVAPLDVRDHRNELRAQREEQIRPDRDVGAHA